MHESRVEAPGQYIYKIPSQHPHGSQDRKRRSIYMRPAKRVLQKDGYKHFFLWLTEDYPQLPEPSAGTMDLFERELARGPLRWPEPNGILDAYRLLASGWVNAGRRNFVARDLFRLASQLRIVGSEHATAVLARVRDRWVRGGKYQTPWRVFRPSRYRPLFADLSEANQVFELQTDPMDVRTFPVALNSLEEQLLVTVGKGLNNSPFVM
jgi:hypothetical protein